MKRFLFFVLLLCSSAAFAQSAGPTNLTGSQCLSTNIFVSTPIVITVTGSWSGILQPQVLGQIGQNVTVTPIGITTPQPNIQANGIFTTTISGPNAFQVCAQSISGTATVTFAPPAQTSTAGNLTGSQCLALDVYIPGLASVVVTGNWSGQLQPQVYVAPPLNGTVNLIGVTTPQSTILNDGTYTTYVTVPNVWQLCAEGITGTASLTMTSAVTASVSSGSVTSVSSGVGLTATPNPLTNTGTIALNPALPNGETATTQTTGDDSTKVATDAFVQANGGIVTFFGNTPGSTLSSLADPTTLSDASGSAIAFTTDKLAWSDTEGDGCFGQTGTVECLDGSGDFMSLSDGVMKFQTATGSLLELTGSAFLFNDGTAPTISSTGGSPSMRIGGTTFAFSGTAPSSGSPCFGYVSAGVMGGITCGGSGGGNPQLENCTPDETGNSFYNVTPLTNYFNASWQFVFNTTTYFNCTVYIPTAQSGATVAVDVWSSDSTAGHTASITYADGVINSGTMNIGALTAAANQTFTTTSTANNRVTKTFNVQSTLSNGSILVIQIGTAPTGTAPTANINVYPHFVL